MPVLCECGCMLQQKLTEYRSKTNDALLLVQVDYYCECCGFTENDYEKFTDDDTEDID